MECEEVLWIDTTEDGWRLDLKENHIQRGLRVAWRWGMVGVGVREGTRLVWVGGSTWLNTRALLQHVQFRSRDPHCHHPT